MAVKSDNDLLLRIEELESRLAEAEELIEAIKAGEVDAFTIIKAKQAEVYTLQSGDFAYRLLIEKIGEGALNITEDGLIVYTNVYFSELTGLPYEKVVGSMIFDMIDERSKEDFDLLFNQAIAGSSKGEICLKASERSIPVYISLTSLGSNLPTIGMIITDLTEKKQSEKVILNYQDVLKDKNVQLEQQMDDLQKLSVSDKLKSDFIKVASHELNTPVTSIKGYVQLLLSMSKQIEPGSPMPLEILNPSLAKIDSQVQRLVRLISELLDLSRIEGGQLLLNKEIIGINDLITEVVQDISITNPGKKINLSSTINCKVKGDWDRLSQAFSNLILNAVKYSPSSDNIDISVNAFENNSVAISIRDYGIGIDKEDHSKIFERFFRSEKDSGHTYPGFGIGLFISKEIIQRHNGYILLESEKGRGSTFKVVLQIV